MDEDNTQPPTSLFDSYRTEVFSYHGMENYSLAWNHFEKCRQLGQFTDIIIRVEGKEFPCHKILLDSCCPYFSAYFSFSNTEQQNTVCLKGVSLSSFTKLIDFIYTATLTVSADEVIDLLECADFLQLRDLVHACSGFLLQHINYDTCLKIFQLAEAHLLPDLKEAAWEYIQTHFKDVAQSESFLHTPKDLLNRIVTSRTLKVDSEMIVLKSIINWVIFRQNDRKRDLCDLISPLGLSQTDVDTADVLSMCGKEMYDQLMNCTGVTRISRYEQVMVVVSRDTNSSQYSTNDVFFYNPETSRWHTMTSFPFEKRHHFGVALRNNKLYLTGGVTTEVPLYDKQKQIFSEAWEYDVLADTWRQVQSMNGVRYNHSSATLQDLVYIVGGRGNRKITVRPDGEVYNAATDQWTSLPAIKEVQGIGNAALTPLDGKLYLLGGMHSSVAAGRRDVSFDSYKGAQYYNPLDNEWHDLAILSSQIDAEDLRLSRTDCVAVDGFLLLINDQPGKRLKVYNPVTNRLSDFILSHGYHKFGGCHIFRDELVISGGLEDKFRAHDMVHCLDLNGPPSDWKMLSPLPVSLSHHTCLNVYVDLKALNDRDNS
ncbi:kelch-like protein 12 [Haliotis rufescens]|uniref:kelch-like protein 12 n=1 Tax=Haliotis rufescens TaxID=6454 RepID=UPI00201E9581|nr:kelch-like protein 12 [Haliotis rufescens]